MTTPRMGYCPRCKQDCEISFATKAIHEKTGKVILPKKGKVLGKVRISPRCEIIVL
ncbi:hypothetical protein [Citrobacter portucalensis]|uniref:hypothetical protein n=1 Tax=Citrobacter portucalensis TaxID=1639133 RepID=UPI0018A4B59E|nr:hypothetical protein [Citrobacter portucalensis]BBV46966.1 hypothetical protein STW0522CIT27_34060 [Citrobacter portucalensis]BBW15771.1 hypothetical protein STN0717CIT36_11950 [Citrobacter portucalensis]BBW42185.1 hypothetical protein STN0717CIT72_36410 [Citrobacter portucalensis]